MKKGVPIEFPIVVEVQRNENSQKVKTYLNMISSKCRPTYDGILPGDVIQVICREEIQQVFVHTEQFRING